jgi:RNA polymerase sigma-70 factor (ECF subfamily)
MNGTWRAAAEAADPVGSGHQERMRILYQVHADALVRALLHWTKGDRQAAEDLMQETMLRAWRNLDALYADPVSLRPWLITVSRRIAIDSLRARAARPVETASDDSFEWLVAPDPFEQVLNRELIHKLLAGLSAEHRNVLLHVYIHDLTVPQTARILGVPEGTVKSRLHSARAAVRAGFAAPAGVMP